MTVQTTINRSLATGNGASTVFNYDFRILDQSHLVVTLFDAAGVGTVKTLGSDYTVTGVGDALGGTVVFAVAPPTTITNSVVIERVVPLTQLVDYIDNDSFPADVTENAMDKLTMICQYFSDYIARALIVSAATGTFSGSLPSPVGAGGKFVAVKVTEDGVEFIAPGSATLAIPADGSVTYLKLGTNVISGASAETAPAIDDLLLVHDTSANTRDKLRLDDLLKVVNGLTEDVTPDTTADFVLIFDTSAGTAKKAKPSSLSTAKYASTRQTVLSGPVDANGLPSFGGSTGSTTVTATGTLIATAANGFDANGALDRVGSIVNPSWTGLSTNGTMYLYGDISPTGVITTGAGTLAPTYRNGGADVITSGQFTFNVQEMVGKVGNGAAAVQTYRVYFGEVTVAGGVVTAITWYALMGRFRSALAAMPALSSVTNINHNIGTTFLRAKPQGYMQNTIVEQNYAVGDIVPMMAAQGANRTVYENIVITGRNSLNLSASGSGTGWYGFNKTTWATQFDVTLANWNYFVVVERGW